MALLFALSRTGASVTLRKENGVIHKIFEELKRFLRFVR
ncbi:hypothetical protein Krac_12398 [Ktedonobacter racemifer DSM 44963]|uniref:Uncharacterized protein n=1 Tax=Ktedonobacter racemifer DSM 44963 TaxID=485913 RepID=D6TH21_KTERA|nr:hypothetical protein Krac_12398 [Ktedonobacter racemifer DSM 44963]